MHAGCVTRIPHYAYIQAGSRQRVTFLIPLVMVVVVVSGWGWMRVYAGRVLRSALCG